MGNKILASQEEMLLVKNSLYQTAPFLFVDEITELSEDHIVGNYRFKEDEYFYKGHFPGNPITPGVILIETMVQMSVVCLGSYILYCRGRDRKTKSVFTECEVDFSAMVPPGSLVTVHGKKIYERFGKLKCEARLVLEDGTVAASGKLAGVEVK